MAKPEKEEAEIPLRLWVATQLLAGWAAKDRATVDSLNKSCMDSLVAADELIKIHKRTEPLVGPEPL